MFVPCYYIVVLFECAVNHKFYSIISKRILNTNEEYLIVIHACDIKVNIFLIDKKCSAY